MYHTNDLDICAAPQPKSLYISHVVSYLYLCNVKLACLSCHRLIISKNKKIMKQKKYWCPFYSYTYTFIVLGDHRDLPQPWPP